MCVELIDVPLRGEKIFKPHPHNRVLVPLMKFLMSTPVKPSDISFQKSTAHGKKHLRRVTHKIACSQKHKIVKSMSPPYYPSKHTCLLRYTHQLKNIMNRGVNIISIILQGLSDGNQVLENDMKTVCQREIKQL